MNISGWLVWLVPLVAVPVVPLVSRAWKKATGWFAVGVGGLSLLFALLAALAYTAEGTETYGVWLGYLNLPIEVSVDGLSVLVGVFVAFLSLLILVYSLGYMRGEEGQARYYSLVLLFVGSMLGLVMAGNLIQFYFFWEIVGLCSAFLIAFWSDREKARKAGLKAFAVTRIGDAALLLGIILIFATLQTTSFTPVLAAVGGPSLSGSLLTAVGVLVFLGAMAKSAQVPFHVWLPDAMEGPTTVSALIHAATMVNAGVYLVIRMFPLFQASSVLLEMVLFVGLLSSGVGAVCAFTSNDIKRILAYSTISQLGLMFAALGLGSWAAATYHMISQGLFKALAFLAAGSVIAQLETRNIEEMGGLRKVMKVTYVGFLLSVLAMSGLPPLIGFWSKDAIVSIAFSGDLPAAAAILAVSLMTAAYGFRALIKVFHGKGAWKKEVHESGPAMTVPIAVLSVSVVLAWLALGGQGYVSLPQLPAELTVSLALSLGALALGAVVSYEAFSARAESTAGLVARSAALRSLRKALLGGLGFDALFGYLYDRGVGGAARLASSVQTGLLDTDSALLLLVLVLAVVMAAAGEL
jgi:NADH-quinone oxidoreductase subunit L